MWYFPNPPGKTAVFPENSTFVQNGTLQQVLTTYRRPIYHIKAYDIKCKRHSFGTGHYLRGGGGLENVEIVGLKMCAPPSRQGKAFCAPLPFCSPLPP